MNKKKIPYGDDSLQGNIDKLECINITDPVQQVSSTIHCVGMKWHTTETALANKVQLKGIVLVYPSCELKGMEECVGAEAIGA